MPVKNPDPTDLKVAYIGGGSRGWAWMLMSDLAQEASLAGSVALYDINHPAAEQNAIIGNRLSAREDIPGKWRYEAIPTLDAAIKDADFVVISILPGTFDHMAIDVHVPEKYGIYQAVGDTTGPGGHFRAHRTIPAYVRFAKAIAENCPNAWVINYTNPMALCVRTLYEVFPQVKAFGCCHEVAWVQRRFASLLHERDGGDKVSHKNISINVQGINHLTWVNRASYGTEDLIPLFDEWMEKVLSGEIDQSSILENGDPFQSGHRVKFDLYRQFGILAAAGDRHLAEFFPNTRFLKDPDTVKSWYFKLTPIDFRKNQQARNEEKARKFSTGKEELNPFHTGEEGVALMKALLGMGDMITNVNMPNRGQMENLPKDSIVETNVHFTKDSADPLASGSLPLDVQSIVNVHIANQEMTLHSILDKDRDLAFRAFKNDPLLVNLSVDDAFSLFEEMDEGMGEFRMEWNSMRNGKFSYELVGSKLT